MSLKKITDVAVRVIRDLPNRPTGTGRMSASELKAAFDQAADAIKDAYNQMIDQLESADGAGYIGFRRSTEVSADNVQTAIENVQSQIRGVSQGAVANGSINADKLAKDAARWVDVSSEIRFENIYSIGDGAVTQRRISAWKMLYAPALGIVRYRIRLYLKTTGMATSLVFRMFGNYLPKADAMNGGPAAVSPALGDNTIGNVWASVEVDDIQNYYDLVVSANAAVDAVVEITGWYFCEGEDNG